MKNFFILEESDLEAAQALKMKFVPEAEVEIRFFGQKSSQHCFAGMDEQDFKTTLWLGHSGANNLGDFNVETFLQKFEKEFLKVFPKTKKNCVQHLYFISCELGLLRNGNSMAQSIVDGLHRHGFTEVVLHAIASLPESASLLVKVTCRTGIERKAGREDGDIRAYSLNEEDDQLLAAAEKTLAVVEPQFKERGTHTHAQRMEMEKVMAEAQSVKIKIESETTILDTGDPRTELDRPHNIFTPFPVHPRPLKNLQQEKALFILEKNLQRFKRDAIPNESSIEFLQTLCNVIKNETGDWWLHIENEVHGLHPFRSSEIREILNRIREECKPVPATEKFPQRKNKKPVPLPPMPAEMQGALNWILLLAEKLQTEQHTSCITFFSPKPYKFQVLMVLAAELRMAYENNPRNPEWEELIEKALEDKKLTRGIIRHQTKDALERMVGKGQKTNAKRLR